MRAQWRGERAQKGRFIIAFCPLLPGIHALLVWMSQLTSSDNREPGALSKGTTVIVLIGPPLLCWVHKMLSNVIAPQHRRLRHTHTHIKKDDVCFLLTEDNNLALWQSPWHPCKLEQAALSVIAGSGPLASRSIRRLGSQCVTFKLANNNGRANQSGSGLMSGGLCPSGVDVQLLWPQFHFAPPVSAWAPG